MAEWPTLWVDLHMAGVEEPGHIVSSVRVGQRVRVVDTNGGPDDLIFLEATIDAVRPSPHVEGAWLFDLRYEDSQSKEGK